VLSNQISVHTGQPPRLTSHFGVPVREDVAFANQKGAEKSGIRKHAEKLLDQLQEPLRRFLEPDEAVFSIARARRMPSGFEQFFLGWHAMYLMPGVLIFTNKRLLHLFVRRDGSWNRSIRCACWGDLEQAKAKGLLGARFTAKYRNGTKEVFSSLARHDTQRMQLLLNTFLPSAVGESSPALGMTSLCPDCRSPLTPGAYECPNCHRAFKDEKTATQRSWLIPGGGFFYIGHPVMGILHASGEIVLIWMVGFSLFLSSNVVPQRSGAASAPSARSEAFLLLALFSGILVLNKFIMSVVARRQVRNYIPLT